MIEDVSDTPLPNGPPAPPSRTPPSRTQPRRPPVALVLVASLLSGVAGGIVGANVDRLAPAAQPTPALPEVKEVRVETGSDVIGAVASVLPAVVTIESRTTSGQPAASGSGVVIDREFGYIVTNSHVVEQQRSTNPVGNISVILSDGQTIPAAVMGNDPFTDIAVVKVNQPLPAQVKLADAASIRIGAAVIAIGSPGVGSGRSAIGILSNTVTSGIVSATGRSLPRTDLRDVILDDLVQTDAPINPGMSGGPLVLVATKEVIGLNTLVLRSSGEEGLGFAVSARTVAAIAEQIIANGRVIRGSLGIGFRDSSAGATLVVAGRQGALVTSVPSGSAGAAAGIRPGDLIVRVNEIDVSDRRPLRSILLGFRPGNVATLTIMRNGQEQHVTVTLAEGA